MNNKITNIWFAKLIDVYLKVVTWLFLFWWILISNSLTFSYKAGIEDARKAIAEQQNNKENIV